MFLSGDNFNSICNISIYERNYYNSYIKNNDTKNVIFVNENNDELLNNIVNQKNIFFIKLDYIKYFLDIVLPKLKISFILITHNGDNTCIYI